MNVGISDGRVTEVSSAELQVNDKVIVGENQSNETASSSTGTMRFRMF